MSQTYKTASGKTVMQLLTEFAGKAETSLGRQLYREATGVVTASIPLVPVDTETLRSSNYVAEPERIGSRIVVQFGYGGPAAKINPKSGESSDGYAIYVHENLEAFHKVGTAKFLEMPFDQAKPGMGNRIAKGMVEELHSGAAAQNDLGTPPEGT